MIIACNNVDIDLIHCSYHLSATTLREVIEAITMNFPLETSPTVINVTRDDVIPGLLRGFKRKTFNCQASVSVKFMAEEGCDQGGLRSECFTLAFRQIADSKNICQGDNGKLLIKDQIGMKHFSSCMSLYI